MPTAPYYGQQYDTNPRVPPQAPTDPYTQMGGGGVPTMPPQRPPIPAGGGATGALPTGWQGVGNILNRMDPAMAAKLRAGMMQQEGTGGNRYNWMLEQLKAQNAPGVGFLPGQGAGAFDWNAWNQSLGQGPDGGPEPTPMGVPNPRLPPMGGGDMGPRQSSGRVPYLGGVMPPPGSEGVPPMPPIPQRPPRVYSGKWRSPQARQFRREQRQGQALIDNAPYRPGMVGGGPNDMYVNGKPYGGGGGPQMPPQRPPVPRGKFNPY